LAKCATKSDFSRLLNLKDPDHYIGAENDTPGKKPSLDLLERAAQAAGFEFTDFIQTPKKTKNSPEEEQLIRQLLELLRYQDDDGEVSTWMRVSVQTFHHDYLTKPRKQR
jgi:transcriptional regulator with XRE-family HTH domain